MNKNSNVKQLIKQYSYNKNHHLSILKSSRWIIKTISENTRCTINPQLEKVDLIRFDNRRNEPKLAVMEILKIGVIRFVSDREIHVESFYCDVIYSFCYVKFSDLSSYCATTLARENVLRAIKTNRCIIIIGVLLVFLRLN